MTVALVGGLTRLESKYKEKGRSHNIDLRVFTEKKACDRCRIENADAVILLTDLVAHQNAKKVYELARKKDMCLVCSHRSSLSAVERCLSELIGKEERHST